jgi:hypothetical protein
MRGMTFGGGGCVEGGYTQSAYEPRTPPPEDVEDPVDPDVVVTDNPDVDLYIQKQGSLSWFKNVTIEAGDQVSLRWQTNDVTECRSTDATEFTVPGNAGGSGSTNTVLEPTSSSRTYEISCTKDTGGGGGGSNTGVTTVTSRARATLATTTGGTDLPAPSLIADPRIVRKGEISALTWDTGGRTGCMLKKGIAGTETPLTTTTGTISSDPIKGETFYFLTCPDGSGAVTSVRMLPVYSET